MSSPNLSRVKKRRNEKGWLWSRVFGLGVCACCCAGVKKWETATASIAAGFHISLRRFSDHKAV